MNKIYDESKCQHKIKNSLKYIFINIRILICLLIYSFKVFLIFVINYHHFEIFNFILNIFIINKNTCKV
jgi:hypothetical protein